MLSTAKVAVSWSIPTLTQFLARTGEDETFAPRCDILNLRRQNFGEVGVV